MAEQNITTYYDIRQRQEEDQPSAFPESTDLVYVQHGTGSDRNRVFTLGEIFGMGDQIDFIQDDGTLTSETIINSWKGGKIPVVYVVGNDQTQLGKQYFFPQWLYFNDDPSVQNVNRDAVFYALEYGTNFGDNDKRGHTLLQTRRYYNNPYQSIGEQRDFKEIDVTVFDSLDVSGSLGLKDWSITANSQGLVNFSYPNSGGGYDSVMSLTKYLASFSCQVKLLNDSNTIEASADITLSESQGGSSVYIGGYSFDAPFAILNTGGTNINVTLSGGSGTWLIQPNCARWFVRHKVGNDTKLFAF